MSDWDKDSRQLRQNLTKVLEEIVLSVEHRRPPSLADAKRWHQRMMKGLSVPGSHFVGAFRGETGLEDIQVRVGTNYGTDADGVALELNSFEKTLQTLVAELDQTIPIGTDIDADQLSAVLDLCAWVHAEWVRIHPFANGNGRIARLWANSIAMRYGLPPFIRLRPRPDSGYAEAGEKAMQRDWKPTAIIFRRLLDSLLAPVLAKVEKTAK